jgi:non-heme chloroperoxidase
MRTLLLFLIAAATALFPTVGSLMAAEADQLAQPNVSGQWGDPAAHSLRIVSVANDVRLEVLDWGGTGKPMILLAGGGFSAHVFDDFAPKLAVRWHVFGISRRGYGLSGYSPVDNAADQLGDDVVAVMSALKIDKPVLVGHSVAGSELTSIANRHPNLIKGLVYLDAAYSYAFHNGKGFDVNEIQSLQPPKRPGPGSADLASFSALQKYQERMDGFRYPEAELRQQWETDGSGRITRQRDLPGSAMVSSLIATPSRYTNIPLPSLIIFANPHSQGPWVEKNADPVVRSSAKTYSAALAVLTARQVKAVKDALPAAQVVQLRNAHHFVFLSNEAATLQMIRDFVSSLH